MTDRRKKPKKLVTPIKVRVALLRKKRLANPSKILIVPQEKIIQILAKQNQASPRSRPSPINTTTFTSEYYQLAELHPFQENQQSR